MAERQRESRLDDGENNHHRSSSNVTLFPRSRSATYPSSKDNSSSTRQRVEEREIALEIPLEDVLFVIRDPRDSRIFCVVAKHLTLQTDATCYIFKAPNGDQRSIMMECMRKVAGPAFASKADDYLGNGFNSEYSRHDQSRETPVVSSTADIDAIALELNDQEITHQTTSLNDDRGTPSTSLYARTLEARLSKLEIAVEREKSERVKMEERLFHALDSYESLHDQHQNLKRLLSPIMSGEGVTCDESCCQGEALRNESIGFRTRPLDASSRTERELSPGHANVGDAINGALLQDDALLLQSPDSGHGDVSFISDSESSLANEENRLGFTYDASMKEYRSNDGSGRRVRFGFDVEIHRDAEEGDYEGDADDELEGKAGGEDVDYAVVPVHFPQYSRGFGKGDAQIPRTSVVPPSSSSSRDCDYADFLSPLLFAASREKGRAYSAKKLNRCEAKLFCRDLSTVYSSQSQACFNYFRWTKNGDGK